MKQLEGTGDPGKVSHDIGEVHQHQQRHDEKRHAQAELFANQVREALAGNRAHARAHLLSENQGDGDWRQRPEREIPETRPGLRIRDDAAGVVIDNRGNESRAEDPQEDRDPDAQRFEHRPFPSLVPQHGNNIVSGNHAHQTALFVYHGQRQQVVFIE